MEAVDDRGSFANSKALRFTFLPEFARFLLEHKMDELAREQLRLTRAVDYPLLKFFDFMPEEQLLELVKAGNVELLTHAINNTLTEQIATGVVKWRENQLPLIARDQVVSEDITLASYIRKKAWTPFVNEFTADHKLVMAILGEIDDFALASESASFKAYADIQEERLTKAALDVQKKEAMLLEAQEIAGIGSFEWDLVGKNTSFTPEVGKIFEIENASKLSDFLKHVHPDDRTRVNDEIKKAIEGDGSYECEYRYKKNGAEKIIWSRGVVSFENGRAYVMTGTVMDVTERHTILEKVKQSEQLYKQAQELTHIGNWSWDVVTGKIVWSDEMYRRYGLEPQSEEILFDRFLALMHPDDREMRMDQIKRTMATGKAEDYVLRVVTPAGDINVLEGKGHVILNEAGEVIKMLGTCRDITVEYGLSKQLEEEKQLAEMMTDTSVDLIVAYSKDLKVIALNKKCEERLNVRKEQVLGKKISDMKPYIRGEQRVADIQRALNGELVHYKEEQFNNIEGYFESYIMPIRDTKGQIFAALELMHDITESKKASTRMNELNLSLEEKNKELERSNAELTSFSYVASHDLQEPLRKIRTFTNMITEREVGNLSERGKELFGRIHTSAGRMQRLIEDLLTFSRAQQDTNQFAAVNMKDIVKEITAAYDGSMADKSLVIEVADLPVVNGVAFQLHQLMDNIILNSIKYARPGVTPHITITCNNVPGKDLPFSGIDANKKFYQIIVADNGIGFEPKYAEKIFEIFQRLHAREEYSGTGIGLAICKKIVQNHGGYIYARGEVNKGAQLFVCLPA